MKEREDWQPGEFAEYKEGGEIFPVEVLTREVGPLSNKDQRRFLTLGLRNIRTQEEFSVYCSLEPEDQGAAYLVWKLFPTGTYLMGE